MNFRQIVPIQMVVGLVLGLTAWALYALLQSLMSGFLGSVGVTNKNFQLFGIFLLSAFILVVLGFKSNKILKEISRR